MWISFSFLVIPVYDNSIHHHIQHAWGILTGIFRLSIQLPHDRPAGFLRYDNLILENMTMEKVMFEKSSLSVYMVADKFSDFALDRVDWKAWAWSGGNWQFSRLVWILTMRLMHSTSGGVEPFRGAQRRLVVCKFFALVIEYHPVSILHLYFCTTFRWFDYKV